MTAEGSSDVPTQECDCDYWHSKHRWHCATNYDTATSPAPTANGAS